MIKKAICIVLPTILIIGSEIQAQDPMIPYYYNASTELSWAECYIYQSGGSKHKILFLPVVGRNFQRAPLGTNNYSQDVCVNGPVVFIGNGIVDRLASLSGRNEKMFIENIENEWRVSCRIRIRNLINRLTFFFSSL